MSLVLHSISLELPSCSLFYSYFSLLPPILLSVFNKEEKNVRSKNSLGFQVTGFGKNRQKQPFIYSKRNWWQFLICYRRKGEERKDMNREVLRAEKKQFKQFLMHISLSVQFSCSLLTDSLWPPRTAAHQASLSITNSRSLLKLMSIRSVMRSNHLILCHPLLLLPSIFPSIRVLSNESAFHIRWPQYWSFSFSISPSNEYSGLIYFEIDWLNLLAVQRTLKSLLQDYSSKASVLRHSLFL